MTMVMGMVMMTTMMMNYCLTKGVGICQTKAQQTLIQQRLKDFARTMNLVSLTGAPRKPDALIQFEAKLNRAKAADLKAGAPSIAAQSPVAPMKALGSPSPTIQSSSPLGSAKAGTPVKPSTPKLMMKPLTPFSDEAHMIITSPPSTSQCFNDSIKFFFIVLKLKS